MKKIDTQLIILDLDHTLFNTTKYVERLQQDLKKVGISKDEFWKKRKALKDCCHLVDMDMFVESLSVKNAEEIHEVMHNTIEQHAWEFIFPDVADFIARHEQDFDLLILTQGDDELQSEKIIHSDLPSGVRHKIVSGKKVEALEDIVEFYDRILFIDDKAKNIDDIRKAYPDIETYFLQRPEDEPYAHIDSKCASADHVLTSLKITISKKSS